MRRTGVSALSPALAAGMILAGCGSGNGDAFRPATASGVLKDANVAGLSYRSGDERGTTAADGGFTYEVSEDVTFFLGELVVGTTRGRALITPIDFVPNGSSGTVAVQNIVRFLLMLDDDDNPDNGIGVSSAVRERAETTPLVWKPVDFSVDPVQLDAELNLIIFDLNKIEGSPQSLPTSAQAKAHLEATLRCVHSGAFRGVLSGGDTGRLGITVDAASGEAAGYALLDNHPPMMTLSGAGPVSLDQNAFFGSADAGAAATFTGRLTGPDNIAGNWVVAPPFQPLTGTFLGERIGRRGGRRLSFLWRL